MTTKAQGPWPQTSPEELPWGSLLTRPGRAAARALHEATCWPQKTQEAWRFVSLRELAQTRWVKPSAPAPSAAALQALSFEQVCARLVFVDGQLELGLSTLPEADAGVEVLIMDAQALDDLPAPRAFEDDHFATLAAAASGQGVRVRVRASDTRVQGALHLLHVQRGPEATAAHLRHRVEVAAGSVLSIIEDYAALAEGDASASALADEESVRGWTNALVELTLGPNALVEHVKLQREGLGVTHIARTSVELAHGARYASVTINAGAALCRHDLHAEIAGADTTCELHGLALIDGRQVSDTHSTMNHSHPHAKSDQLHKCVVGGRAHAVFNGKILVRPGAQQINAFQLNRNLLLTATAKVDTKPQLEIFADDVKCSHGATIGQLDEDHLFYLQTRGIQAERARGLLTYAFAAEVVERITQRGVRRWVESLIASRVSA